MAVFNLAEVKMLVLEPGSSVAINVAKGELIQIESAGMSGTNGSLYLCDSEGNKIALLYSSIDAGAFSSSLPFPLSDFEGKIVNESKLHGIVSVAASKAEPPKRSLLTESKSE